MGVAFGTKSVPGGVEFGKKILGVGNSEKNPKDKKFAKKTQGGDAT